MNYTIEDNLCFLDELAKTLKDSPVEEKEVCLISGAELEKKYVTLNCGHKFNYKDIYNEVVYQKKTNLDPRKLAISELRCPYCRFVQPKLLPQFKGFSKVTGVNAPEKYCMYMFKCTYKDRNNVLCDLPCNDDFCNKHKKIKPKCACKTKTGTMCKNGGDEYLNLKYLGKDKIILCKTHHNLYRKNVVLYENGKINDMEQITKII